MAVQESKLVIVIDSQRAKKDIEELSRELKKLYVTGDDASESIDKLGRSTNATSNITQNFNMTASNSANAIQKQTRELERQEGQISKNSEAFKAMAKIIAGYIALDKGIAAADGYTQKAAQIKNATKSTQEYMYVQERLFQTANTTYRSLSEAQEVYLGVESSIKLMGKTTKQALDVTDSLSFAFTANATSIDKAQSALNAYGKALDAGKISNDQWISIMQAVPAVASDISKYLKESGQDIEATEQKVRRMGLTGMVSVELLTNALEANRSKYKDLADAMDNSFVDGLTKLTNSVTKFLGELNMSTGATNNAAAALGFLGDHVDKLAIAGGVAASIYTGRLVSAFVLSAQKATWSAAAIATQTGAMNASAIAARNLYMALGGPVGLAVGIAGTVASMYLLRDSVKETTPLLDKQNKSVQDLVKEYENLDQTMQRQATKDQIDEVKKLTEEHKKQSLALAGLGRVVLNNTDLSNEDRKAAKALYDQYVLGKINSDQFATGLSKLSSVSAELKDRIDKQSGATTESNKAMEIAVRIRNAFLEKSKEIVNANNNEARSIDAKRVAQQKLNAEQQGAFDKIKDQIERENYVKHNMKGGWSRERAEYFADVRADAKMGYLGASMPAELLKMAESGWKLQQQSEARKKAEQATTKELKNQESISKRVIGISGNSGIGTGAHLDVRYGGSRDGQKVSKEHLARLEAGGKSLSSYRVSSDYGQRKAPTKGASSFHKGIDFAMPVGTPITTKVAVKDVKTAYDAKGGGYYSTVTFEDGVVLKLLHQAPSMLSKVKGGASDGTLKSNQDLEREVERQANTQLQLQMAVATERKRIETQLQKDLEEINKAGFSPEETKRLTAEYQARANNDIAIAEYALKTKLDDYEAFKKTESQLLEDSFNERKFYAARDLELTKDQRDKAVALLDEQLKHEQGLLMLAQETRLFQMREQFLNETVAMEQRYDLEHRKLIEIKDVREREYKAEMLRLQKMSEIQQRLKTASQNWATVQADMNGISDQYRLSEERDYRAKQSGELADAEYQSLAQAAQDPNANMEEIAAQREAIWQAHHDRMEAIEQQYYVDSQSLQLTGMGQIANGLSSIIGDMAGKQSSAYRAMFAVEKGFAIAQSALAIQTGVSKAIALGFPQNVPVIAQTVMEGAKIASAIKSITTQGFETGGYTGSGGRKDIAGVVHGQEYVLNAAATKRVGVGTLDAINSGKSIGRGDVIAPITVHVSVQSNGESSVDAQGQSKQLGQMIGNAVRTIIRQEQRQGGLLSK